jgi:hypothetical protein
MPELFLLVGRRFVAAGRSRWDLALENLVLRHQLQVALRTNPRPRLRGPDRILWVWLRRLWPRGWWGPTFVLRSSIRDGSTLRRQTSFPHQRSRAFYKVEPFIQPYEARLTGPVLIAQSA